MNDILTDNVTGDLIFKDGDLVIGFSDFKHQEDLLIAQKGDYKQYPEIGVGIEDFINESDIDGLIDEVRKEFVKDGMRVENISFDEQTGKLDYDAVY